MEKRSFARSMADIRAVLSSQPVQKKLRSKSPVLETGETGRSRFFKTPGLPFVKAGQKPRGIVFHDESFLVVYEEWSYEDELLSYKYQYYRPDDGWSLRYDMGKEERPDHPKQHVQVGALDENLRLPTGEVRCEKVIEMICEQIVA